MLNMSLKPVWKKNTTVPVLQSIHGRSPQKAMKGLTTFFPDHLKVGRVMRWNCRPKSIKGIYLPPLVVQVEEYVVLFWTETDSKLNSHKSTWIWPRSASQYLASTWRFSPSFAWKVYKVDSGPHPKTKALQPPCACERTPQSPIFPWYVPKPLSPHPPNGT